jgi:hypothetical protein
MLNQSARPPSRSMNKAEVEHYGLAMSTDESDAHRFEERA